jgi:hypothetical protein
VTVQKWGGLASFLMAVVYPIPSLIYLTGDLRHAIGPFAYAFADFLYGPVWAASLVTAVVALRERVGERAPHRMTLALLAAFVAAGAFVAVACIRSANRQYHLMHPDLHLETSTTVLIVWATLVAGMIGTAWHFLGWTWLLIGSAGWTSHRLPRALSALYLVGGTASLFAYLLPDIEAIAVALGVVVSIWQGVLLWRAGSLESQVLEPNAGQSDHA